MADVMPNPKCPSSIAQGRQDRCGVFSVPPTCSGNHCMMMRTPVTRQPKLNLTDEQLDAIDAGSGHCRVRGDFGPDMILVSDLTAEIRRLKQNDLREDERAAGPETSWVDSTGAVNVPTPRDEPLPEQRAKVPATPYPTGVPHIRLVEGGELEDLLARADVFLQAPGLMPGRNAVSECLVRDLASALDYERALRQEQKQLHHEETAELEWELAKARDTREQVFEGTGRELAAGAAMLLVDGRHDERFVVLRASAEGDSNDGA